MKKFQFSRDTQSPNKVFSGQEFYNTYKDSVFLRDTDCIETILTKGHELRQMLKGVDPGEKVTVEGVWLKENLLLLVRGTGPNVVVDNLEFTANRLSGLTAAYTFDNRQLFPVIKSSEAIALGLTWDHEDIDKCRLYLSAVSGTEHFWDQFGYWPLVCGLKKYQLGKITLKPLVKMAKIKNSKGDTMGKSLMKRLNNVMSLWERFPGSHKEDFSTMYLRLPTELTKVLKVE